MPACCACSKLSDWLRKPIRIIMCLLEIGLGVAIINVIYWHLTNFDADLNNGSVVNYQCLLGTLDSGNDLCIYGYIVSGIALGAAVFLFFSVIFSCACWLYLDFILDFIVTVLLAIIWFAAAAVITDYNNNKVQNETDVQKSWRDSVTTMSWIMFGLFFVDALFSSFRFLYKCCGCCGGWEADRLAEAKEELKKKDEELATLKTQLAGYTLPPQAQAMQVVQDPANPGMVAVAVAHNNNGAGPEASGPSAKPPAASAPSKSGVYPPVPAAGAYPP